MGLLAAGLVYFTQISADGSYVADLLPGFFLIGVGLGFAFVPISIAALSGAIEKEAGLASGLINTNQQIGGAIGLAILISISTTRSDNLIDDGVAQARRADRRLLARVLGGGRDRDPRRHRHALRARSARTS